MECAEAEAAQAVRAMPVFWSDLGGQNCCRGRDGLTEEGGCLWDFGRESEKFAVVGDFWRARAYSDARGARGESPGRSDDGLLVGLPGAGAVVTLHAAGATRLTVRLTARWCSAVLCFGEGFIYSSPAGNDANSRAAATGWCGVEPNANRADAGESVSFDGSGQDLWDRGRRLISCNVISVPLLAGSFLYPLPLQGGPRKKNFRSGQIIVKFSGEEGLGVQRCLALPCLVTTSHRMAFPAACWEECVSCVFQLILKSAAQLTIYFRGRGLQSAAVWLHPRIYLPSRGNSLAASFKSCNCSATLFVQLQSIDGSLLISLSRARECDIFLTRPLRCHRLQTCFYYAF